MFYEIKIQQPNYVACLSGIAMKFPKIFRVTFLFFLALLLTPQGYATANIELYTHTLSQSTGAYQIWTAPPSRRIFKDDTVPPDNDSEVKVYAAKNEFEPFQVIVRPAASGNVTVNIGDFGSGITTEIYQVKYVPVTQATDSLGRTGPYPDPLWPLTNGNSVSLSGGENTAFWFSVAVPGTVASGDYSTNVQIGGITIPITLHVFDFAIPAELHVKSQMNFSHNDILTKYAVPGTGNEYWMYVDMIKQFFIDHRLTPKSALWSGGLTSSGGSPYIDYNCNTAILSDPHGIWGFEQPASRYLDGTGLMNGTFAQSFNDSLGFPSFMGATFQNNDASADQRPGSFCSLSRTASDWYSADNPTSPYNQKWFEYVTALEGYLNGLGYLDRTYYYFANEPQDQDDYDAVAWYSRYLKQAAPNLQLMVSENPRAEIYNHSNYVSDGQIDIWLPVLNQYDPTISHNREKEHGEESWVYFLHGTRPPYFNPITLDHPGIESKLTGWFLWKYRIRGLAYYSLNNWSQNPWTDPLNSSHNGDLFMFYPPNENNGDIGYGSNNHRLVPSIRFELMRDSLEDYEYLYVLNSNSRPEVEVLNPADSQADKIISSLTAYTRSDEFIYNLRRLIGLKNGGEIATIPDIQPPVVHPRAEGAPGNYYINFQDPKGAPTAEPLLLNGNEYLKIGWNTYDEPLGYGWYGDMAHIMYQYLASGPNELQQSILYDDWGRVKTFEFDLPNGTYEVTVSVGWQGKIYENNQIEIEGISFVDDEATDPYLLRTRTLTVADNKLTMDMGIFNKYTMLNFLEITPPGQSPATAPVPVFYADSIKGEAPLTVHFHDASLNTPTSWQWDFDNNGTIDSTARSPVHTYTTTGTYGVKLTITGSGGSTRELTKEQYIEVTQPGQPNNNGNNGNSDSSFPWELFIQLRNVHSKLK